MVRRLKKTGFVLGVVLCFALSSKAQSPGYMGKKMSAGYGLYANPAFGNIAMGYSDSPVNVLHEFFFEYATGKKFSLGLSAQLYRYTYNNIDNIDAGNSGSPSFRQIESTPSGTYVIKGRNYKLYGKFFKSHYLAPWGKYFLLGIVLNKYNAVYDPDEMNVLLQAQVLSFATNQYEYQRSYLNDFGPTTQSFKKVDIFFGNGNSRILGNRIVLDYGYSIAVIATTRMLLNAVEGTDEIPADEYIAKTSLNRMSAVNRFNFYFKLGYLF